MQNYRSISNLSFISETLENVVSSQLCHHLASNNIMKPTQSAYRKHHSTETTPLAVQNDLLMAIDQKKAAVLVLLDLSAAFDTIDHNILLQRMNTKYGVRGMALDWFRAVEIKTSFSSPSKLLFGIPQGSVLGPTLFSLYSFSIADIARKHGLSVHHYADDTQIYIMFNQDDTVNAISRIDACVAEIKSWMITNKLMLNGDETVIIVISAPRHSVSCDVNHINIDGHDIVPTKTVKNPGVIFYDKLSLDSHIKNICKPSLFHLKNISNIHSFLPEKAVLQLTHAFVSSRLDYCNSLHCKDCLLVPSDVYSPYKILQHAFSRGRVNMNT